jgi:hypothetical protein
MLTDFGNASLLEYTLGFTQTTTLGYSVRWTVRMLFSLLTCILCTYTCFTQAPELLIGKSGHSNEADVYAFGMVCVIHPVAWILLSCIFLDYTRTPLLSSYAGYYY